MSVDVESPEELVEAYGRVIAAVDTKVPRGSTEMAFLDNGYIIGSRAKANEDDPRAHIYRVHARNGEILGSEGDHFVTSEGKVEYTGDFEDPGGDAGVGESNRIAERIEEGNVVSKEEQERILLEAESGASSVS